MTYFQAVFLAFIQGLTEFLPISSSGHLVLFQTLFGLQPPVLFDIFVHLGTLGAILVFFRQELKHFLKKKFLGLIILGTIPAVVIGLFLKGYLDQVFGSLKLVSVSWLITAGLLFLAKTFKSSKNQFSQIKWLDALWIGAFQALAVLPGISRSGATIVAGLSQKLKRKVAFRFSFLLAIPAILGALVLEAPALIVFPCGYLNQALIGMVVAGSVGYLALKLLESFLLKTKFWLFGFYCLLLGIIAFFL